MPRERKNKPSKNLTPEVLAFISTLPHLPPPSTEDFFKDMDWKRKDGSIGRPRNPFFIFKKCFAEQSIVKAQKYIASTVSAIAGARFEAMKLERPAIHEQYVSLAEEEKARHKAAYPTYKYTPGAKRKESAAVQAAGGSFSAGRHTRARKGGKPRSVSVDDSDDDYDDEHVDDEDIPELSPSPNFSPTPSTTTTSLPDSRATPRSIATTLIDLPFVPPQIESPLAPPNTFSPSHPTENPQGSETLSPSPAAWQSAGGECHSSMSNTDSVLAGLRSAPDGLLPSKDPRPASVIGGPAEDLSQPPSTPWRHDFFGCDDVAYYLAWAPLAAAAPVFVPELLCIDDVGQDGASNAEEHPWNVGSNSPANANEDGPCHDLAEPSRVTNWSSSSFDAGEVHYGDLK
ncbi:hypothetical protein DL93DRAFT_1352262 [Clavulina sp. PMI_390]|nr:hypothetical protein DL93DRAFT_1352262 [Clavulina sp. PMI_390]